MCELGQRSNLQDVWEILYPNLGTCRLEKTLLTETPNLSVISIYLYEFT